MHLIEKNINNGLQAKIYASLHEIDEHSWNSINPSMPFFQSYAFLLMIEKIQQTLQFRYVLVYKETQLVAALYFQLLDFSFKNLVNYSSENPQQTGVKTSIKKYIAKKDTKLLNLGNVFFTGDKGIIAANEEEIIERLPDFFNAVHTTFTDKKPAASLLANVYLKDEAKCVRFGEQAFHPFIT